LDDAFYHEPVLLKETSDLLLFNKDKTESKIYVDATLGGGSYTKNILDNTGSDVTVIAIDTDLNSIEYCRNSLKSYAGRIIFLENNFSNIKEILEDTLSHKGRNNISGMTADLGISTYQLEHESGFSYQKDTELDMRAGRNTDQSLTAKEILNTYNERELYRIFRDYGELKYSKQITRDIIDHRNRKKFDTTFELIEVLKKKIPPRYLNKDLSKVFQALRIEVNSELENLSLLLSGAAEYLEIGGRISIVSYHSLEDRIVKNFFRNDERLKPVTKKPVIASDEEVSSNVRARSAKLRAAERTA
jgi:16S rRNA (cytosine1402-N4)-methyltransferase